MSPITRGHLRKFPHFSVCEPLLRGSHLRLRNISPCLGCLTFTACRFLPWVCEFFFSYVMNIYVRLAISTKEEQMVVFNVS